MHRGYFKVWRKIEDNAIWSSKEPFCKRAAWIDLLRMVWWKEKEYLLGKNVYHLEPGEIIISIRYLAEHWRWSTKKVQDFLKVLLQLNQITTKIHPGGTQITICHWEEYQQEGHAEETQKLQGGHAEVTKPIKKEGKKDKKDNSKDTAPPSRNPSTVEKTNTVWEEAKANWKKSFREECTNQMLGFLLKSGWKYVDAVNQFAKEYGGKVDDPYAYALDLARNYPQTVNQIRSRAYKTYKFNKMQIGRIMDKI